ncbi:hypothetical protein GRJ2_003255300 [Grus japonensis]|uniref:ribonuclease H n=1 Tax=Grus japonensis TaxID=30415 RepID=A0ABC9YD82_GRUJA
MGVTSAPSSYANSLAVIDWKSEEAPTVDEVAGRLRQYEESLSSSLVSVAEKLSWKVKQFREDMFYSPPVQTSISAIRMRKSNGEWRLTVDYRGLNEVTPPMSAAVPDMLELQYELESKAAKWYATNDITNVFFSIPLAAECRPQFAFPWRGIQYTWNRLPQGWKHSPTICHGVIQTALEQSEAPEHLQYIDDIIVWGNTAEVSEKGKKLIQILLKAGFAIKESKVKGPAQKIQFLGIKWQDGRHQIPMDVINKIAAMSPLTNKKETQAFLGVVGFWRMHIPNYNLIVSPLYQVTWKKNHFKWDPEQRQAFEQITQEIVHAVALGPVRAGQDIKNVLYTTAGENGPTWSLWQKAHGETRDRPLAFWSRGYRVFEARYTPTKKEILAAYEGVRAASEVTGTEAQLLLVGVSHPLPCTSLWDNRKEEERDDRVYWTVWIRWPGTSDPQKYKALVDTGAQGTLVPSGYRGTEPIWISGVTGGCQELSVLEAEVSLTGDKWEKHPIVTSPEAPCILGIDYLRRGSFEDPKGYRWAFGVATVNTEKIKQLSTLSGLSEDALIVGLLRVEEQQVPIATRTVHRRQYRTN